MGHCGWSLAVGVALLLPTTAAAQLAPVGVPRGTLRLELGGAFENWDERYRDGALEPLAADLASPALGSDRLPALADAEARIGRITGDPTFRLNLGTLTANAQASRNVGTIGLAFGVTSRLTVFGRLPLVQGQLQPTIAFDSATGATGVNPSDPLLGSATGIAQTAQFFQQFDDALGTLQARLNGGAYDASAGQKALAQATLTAGSALRGDLFGLLLDPTTASGFLPLATTAAGQAIATRVAALQSTLAGSLGVPGFAALPALPDQRVSQAELTSYLTNPSGPVGGTLDATNIRQRGDAEIGAAYTLVDRWNTDAKGRGLRIAGSAALRLPTGFRERADRFLDVGTGTRTRAATVGVTADLGSGIFGMRLAGSYQRQFATEYSARVTPPSQPFAPASQIRTIRSDPGDVVALSARPFIRLAPPLAIVAGIDYWRRGAAVISYTSQADSIPGVSASVLATGTRANATTLAFGVTYSNPGRLLAGGTGLPLDVSWTVERVIGSGSGLVPKVQVVRAELRLYQRLFH